MVSSSVVLSFVIAAIATLVAPVAILVALGLKKQVNGLPLALGAAAFFVSQILLRIPLLGLLTGQAWYQEASVRFFLPVLFVVCLSAGLFEESARLAGATFLKENRSFKDILSFGLGHGFCEVVLLIGATHCNNILFSLVANNPGGALADMMWGALTPDMLDAVALQLAAVEPMQVYLGILERFSAVMLHLFATFLVFQGVVKQKRLLYYTLAVLVHTAFNFVAVVAAHYAGLVVSEVLLLAMALAVGYCLMREKQKKLPAAGSAPMGSEPL